MGFKKINWTFIIILITIFSILVIKFFFPSLYLILFSIDPYWIKILLLLWFIVLLLFNLLEFYFFIRYSIDSNYPIPNKDQAKFLYNWIARIVENSKLPSEGKVWLMQVYINYILILISVIFIHTYFFI